jgi:hypothetical protein
VLSHHLAAYPPIVRLAAGGATMAIVYGVLFMLLNADSRFMTLPRRRAAAQTPLP